MAAVGLFTLLALTVEAADPSWWNAREAVMTEEVTTNAGVVTTNYIPNDYAALDEGQLKQFTVAAVNELNANLSNSITGYVGAGTNLNGMVSNWAADYATNGYNATNPKPSDFQAVKVGQLKYIAGLTYQQLIAAGYTASTHLARCHD